MPYRLQRQMYHLYLSALFVGLRVAFIYILRRIIRRLNVIMFGRVWCNEGPGIVIISRPNKHSQSVKGSNRIKLVARQYS